jgi:hypothetical protein
MMGKTSIHSPSPPPGVVEEGGGFGWTELTRARDDIDAHLLVGRLEEAGIETYTIKDRTQLGAWMYGGSDPWAPVAVLVRRIQLEDARLVLAEISFQGPSAAPADEDRGGSGRSGALVWWALALALGLLLTGIALSRTAAVVGVCELPLLCG